MKFAQSLPPDVVVYSNGADVFYVYAKREASRLPAKFDPMQARVNPLFEPQIAALKGELAANRALLIYFDRVDWRWYLPSRTELEGLYQLPVLMRFEDGVVYGLPAQRGTW